MKSLLKMTLIGSFIVLALVGCDDKTDNNGIDSKNEAYSVGALMGGELRRDLERGGIKLDNDSIIKGFSDALRNQSKYTPKEARTIVDELNERLHKEAMADSAVIRTENIEAGDKFRAEFAALPDVKQTDSGLLYQIIDEGSDKHPSIDDVVITHYTGTFVNGESFDSSYNRGEPFEFSLKSGVIEGWREGIPLIGVGGKIKLVIPPELAYGLKGYGAVPPASTLIFEVELLGISDSNPL